ncbi:MAG: Uma2 family endonuclease [Bacteroidetes bacterium]|nr:MAG: Uma2 family endonuclease [Bacteroidota bacterium]
MNILEDTITINGKSFELNEDSIFQNHINISVDEFCELLDQNLLRKFELSNGILIYHQMTTKDHAVIEANLITDATILFRRQKYYLILTDSVGIASPNYDSFYLPDASIVIGKEIEYVKVGKNKKVDAVANAIGIIEILSDSTEEYDRTIKYENYKKIPTLRQYTLISQDKIQVENFVKNALEIWICTVYDSKNDRFAIIEDQFQLCVGDLYLQTSLDENY